MAKAAVSQEEIQLRKRARRRLVGAAFLVLVMVIVLPMILDSEPRPQAESVRVQMPAPPKVEPIMPPSPPLAPPAAPQIVSPGPQAKEDMPLPPSVEEVPESKPDNKPPATAQNAITEGELKPPLVIQLGAFADPANAAQLKDALIGNKIKAFSEEVKTGTRSKTRVRAGPFDSMSDAEKARDRIAKMKLKLGMAPKIVASGQ